MKKGVPVTVTTKMDGADLVLQASAVDVQKQSTGSKVARCLFAYCAGMEDRGVTSVQLLKGDTVAWSYSVNKGRGQKNRQALAEAVAKHLKSEYLVICLTQVTPISCGGEFGGGPAAADGHL